MLITLQFERKDETTLTELMLSTHRDYKVFLCGSLESLAEANGVPCNRCQQDFEANESDKSKDGWIIFAMKTQEETLTLLKELITTTMYTCRVHIQGTDSIKSFFDAKKPVCRKCRLSADEVQKEQTIEITAEAPQDTS